MSTDMSASALSEHDVSLAIPGDVASVRTRLIDAIQHLGYKVLGEQPIYAVTAGTQPAFKPFVTTALPPPPARESVTEGTTELLVQARPRDKKDTAEIETNPMM